MKKIFFHAATATICIGILSIIVVTFWLIYPYDILDIKGEYVVTTPKVKSGELLMFRRNVDKKLNYQADVNCSFVDGVIYNLPGRKSITIVGYDNTLQAVQIPSTLLPGTYYYECDLTFYPNPLRTVTYKLRTTKFEVVK